MELLSYQYFTPRGVTGDELQEIHSIPTAGMSWIYVVLVGLLLCINVIPSVCVLSGIYVIESWMERVGPTHIRDGLRPTCQ